MIGNYFEMFGDEAGEYRWRLVGKNGRIVATSGEGYKTLVACRSGIQLVRSSAQAPLVVEASAEPAKPGRKKKVTTEPTISAGGE